MPNTTIALYKQMLDNIEPADKHNTMLLVSAIITKLLEKYGIKPIVVGGFSVEIYTNRDYSTRDIDFVVNEINKVSSLLKEVGFEKEGRHLYHQRLKVAIEFPDDRLAGSYQKVTKVEIDEGENLYVYVISLEDIIMDRLRASIYWGESESKIWGMKMLSDYYDTLDLDYMKTVGKGAETEKEKEELEKWISELEKL